MEFDLFKEWLPSIFDKKQNLFAMGDVDEIERKYPAFMIAKALSQNQATVFVANQLNQMSSLDPKLQYDFVFSLIPKGRPPWGKWAKAVKSETINIIVEAYNVSNKRAEEISEMLSEDDIENLKSYLFKGGKNGKSK